MKYINLLQKAFQEFDSFSLVWRDQLEFNEECHKIEKELKPFLIREERTDEWPGTKLFGSLATLRYYQINEITISILKQANNFKSWLSPDKPEDLAFYKNEKVVYSSIAHEDDEQFEQ